MAIEIMESDTVVEYVSEWPPRSKETTQSSSVDKTEQSISTNTSPPSTKRLKLVEASSSYACVECLHRNETTRQYKLSKDNSIQLTCCLVEPVEMSSECEKILQKLTSDEISIVNSDYTLSSDVLLARWWKMTLKMGGSADLEANTQEQRVLSLIKSNTAPQSRLYHISRLQKAKSILKCRILHLTSLLPSLSSNATTSEEIYSLHISIATCYKSLAVGLEGKTALGFISSALKHCKAALSEVADSERKGEDLWLSKLLERQQIMEISKERASDKLKRECVVEGCSNLTMPEPIQVERRHFDSLTSKEFFASYAATHTPVVITGLVDHMTSVPWTLDYIKKAIGHKRAPVKRMVNGSVSWAKLEPAGECLVSTFIESLTDQAQDLSYLFDWSLPVNCPELVKELKIPKYFANDFLQRTPSGSLYRDSWPSLFIAPSGITSELHVDAFGSNFWMALFEGQKRWLFFPPEDVPLLYPVYHHSTDATFSVDLSAPDLTLHPLLSLTHPRECTLTPGDVLFVPAGSPHRVENLTRSLAISANFVDNSNIDLVLRELCLNAIQDKRSMDLLDVLQAADFNCEMEDFDSVESTCSPCVQWDHFKSHTFTN